MKRYNHQEERIKILHYLKINRDCIPNLTLTKIKEEFRYADSTFNRLIYWLNGANYVDIVKVGHLNIFQITSKGILLLEEVRKE